MIGYIISFTIGSFFGMFIMALAAIAKQSDKKTEELMRNHFDTNNKEQLNLFKNDSKQLELF